MPSLFRSALAPLPLIAVWLFAFPVVAQDGGSCDRFFAIYARGGEPGPFRVRTETGAWTDPARDGREVPWKIYLPEGYHQNLPLVVWSHGGGGSRDGASYLGEHLASHGFVALHIEHDGSTMSDMLFSRSSIGDQVKDPRLAVDRYLDVKFVARQIIRMASAGPWNGRIDPGRLGISGHSFGAITTLIAAGQNLPGYGQGLAEPAFRGAFAMSPSPARDGYSSGPQTFSRMIMPIFHLTGTQDESPLKDFAAVDRRIPFDSISTVDQYLLVLDGATHMTFAGRNGGLMSRRMGTDPHFDRNLWMIKAAAIVFWDATLNDNPCAYVWLNRGGFQRTLGDGGMFEVKGRAF